MSSKVKKLFSYYKPYRAMLLADLFFAVLGAAVSLIIPLLVRSVTSGSALSGGFSFAGLLPLALLLTALVLIEFGCNYFIGYQGHAQRDLPPLPASFLQLLRRAKDRPFDVPHHLRSL